MWWSTNGTRENRFYKPLLTDQIVFGTIAEFLANLKYNYWVWEQKYCSIKMWIHEQSDNSRRVSNCISRSLVWVLNYGRALDPFHWATCHEPMLGHRQNELFRWELVDLKVVDRLLENWTNFTKEIVFRLRNVELASGEQSRLLKKRSYVVIDRKKTLYSKLSADNLSE